MPLGLDFSIICKCRAIQSCILFIKSWVDFHVPLQRRFVLSLWSSTRPYIATKSSSEWRNIVSIGSSLGSGRFLIVRVCANLWWSSISSWIFHISLMIIRPNHTSAAFWDQDLDVIKKISKVDSVCFLDLKHWN